MSISSDNLDIIIRHLVSAMPPEARQRLNDDLGGSLDALVGDPGLAQDAARHVRTLMSDADRYAFRKMSPKQQRLAMDAAARRAGGGSASGSAASFNDRFPGAARIGVAR